jgi:hypothetical protein
MIRCAPRTVLLVLSVSSVVLAQSASPARFRVALKVSGDSMIASEIESHLKQDLGLLRDVELTDTKPDYTIDIIALEIESKAQISMGIAFTWLTLYHPKGFFEDCSLIEDYRLLTVEREDLQGTCQKLVDRFDARSLEPHRKVFQKAKP